MNEILSRVSPVYGFCMFESLKDSLIECRAKQRLPENAQTVIVFLFPYYLGDSAYDGSDISKYAVVPDYHDVILPVLQDACAELKGLYPDEEFKEEGYLYFCNGNPAETKELVFAKTYKEHQKNVKKYQKYWS